MVNIDEPKPDHFIPSDEYAIVWLPEPKAIVGCWILILPSLEFHAIPLPIVKVLLLVPEVQFIPFDEYANTVLVELPAVFRPVATHSLPFQVTLLPIVILVLLTPALQLIPLYEYVNTLVFTGVATWPTATHIVPFQAKE